MSTLFTRIIEGEIPAKKIYEDDKLIAILDINPVQKGHTLVIPKTEYRRMEECDDETLSHAFLVTKKIMLRMKEELGADYVNVLVEGIEVEHFHIHLIPSTLAVKNAQWTHTSYGEGEMDEYQQKLRMS